MLGLSRPFVARLLDEREIPSQHLPGSRHRVVRLTDVLEFQAQRAAKRGPSEDHRGRRGGGFPFIDHGRHCRRRYGHGSRIAGPRSLFAGRWSVIAGHCLSVQRRGRSLEYR
ncbi:helix-turn-helix transcriptional regulator [Microtetraspora malaysiensis]|uniref:helix-turn-helix transcriptional regulator n=1 Tax=Microtetraspora malaysiensis TaxID=161358 RepID=UPI003D931139